MFKKIKEFVGLGDNNPVVSQTSKQPPKPTPPPTKPALSGETQKQKRDRLIKEMGG